MLWNSSLKMSNTVEGKKDHRSSINTRQTSSYRILDLFRCWISWMTITKKQKKIHEVLLNNFKLTSIFVTWEITTKINKRSVNIRRSFIWKFFWRLFQRLTLDWEIITKMNKDMWKFKREFLDNFELFSTLDTLEDTNKDQQSRTINMQRTSTRRNLNLFELFEC